MILTVPISREFTLTVKEGKNEEFPIEIVAPGEITDPALTFTCSFRQALREQVDAREDFLSKRKIAYDADEGVMVQIDSLNDSGLRREEIYLTLTETDLELPDPKDKDKGISLTFTKGIIPKVLNKSQFLDWYGMLPDQWADKLHECCLEVNPLWNPKRVTGNK